MDIERVAKNAIIEQFSQIEAAERQLDRAISLFISEHDYLCAITLAGAADGILGEALKNKGQMNSGEILKGVMKDTFLPQLSHKEISDQHLNKIRNSLKHTTEDHNKVIEHPMDIEAVQVIVRAILNYGFLTDTATKGSIEFFAWLRQYRPEILEEAEKFDGSVPNIVIPK
jgi:hypothetical protein